MLKTSFENKLLKFIENIERVPEDFFTRRAGRNWDDSEESQIKRDTIWLVSRDDGTAGDYETSQERFGVTKDGKIIWGFSSGCSCWNGWEDSDISEPLSWKDFIMLDTKEEKLDQDWSGGNGIKRDGWGFVKDWQEEAEKSLDDLLLIFDDNRKIEDVLNVRNAEVRAYLIKKMNYEEVRRMKEIKILHSEKEYDLISLEGIEDSLFVKCKDSSTDRIFLLQVPRWVKRCKEAVAWTFGLKEEEYNPLIET